MRISDWSSDVCSSDLLMGDLNEWSAMAGCLRDFGRDYHFAETGPSFHARRPIARLDRIMVSSDLIVADAGVHFSPAARKARSEEHTSELQSLMRTSYAVFGLQNKKKQTLLTYY